MKNRGNGKRKGKERFITAVVANSKGEIVELEGYAAVGMAGSVFTFLTATNTVPMPFGGELMYLPERVPVLYNIHSQRFETVYENPFIPGDPVFPVAAFNSPGYVNRFACAYTEGEKAGSLPLFSYGAVGWRGGGFRSAVILVDSEPRQDLRRMKPEKVLSGVKRMKKIMPDNRLRAHIEHCALTYGCPAAKNFFLGRYEAPLPASKQCNARCLGCLSLQKKTAVKSPQERINFTPTPDEISEIALWHIKNVKKSVVSFGQGCEGDPLLAAEMIEPAILKIRSVTSEGTINMNTNGSLPRILERMFDAGLDSVRISLSSVREECYRAYFQPSGYSFQDVENSIDLAIGKQKFVSINYLNCPGVTDTPQEAEALFSFLHRHPIHFIQWRNLNFDPLRYHTLMDSVSKSGPPIGMESLLEKIRQAFPGIGFGYFNPPKENFEAGFDIRRPA